MTKNWHNGGLLCMYCSGERVPDFTNAKSRVLVKVLVPSDEQGFLDFMYELLCAFSFLMYEQGSLIYV